MATILRLGSRQVLNQVLKNEKSGMLAFVRPVTLKPQPAKPFKDQDHDDRNMKLGRPQSPHLTIYARQLTAMMSISHRFTGMALAGYAVALGTGAFLLPQSIPHYIDALSGCPSVCLFSVKFLLSFPMTYHFANGIRHLLWDMGNFFTIKEIYATGYITLGAAVGSAIVLSLM